MSDNLSSRQTIKIRHPCRHCNGTGIETIEVDENYKTKDGFKVNVMGDFMLFTMGICSKCKKYIPPTWMIYDGDPCPLCGEPFYPSSNETTKTEES